MSGHIAKPTPTVTSPAENLHDEVVSSVAKTEAKSQSLSEKLLHANTLSSVLLAASTLKKSGDICMVLEHVANLRKRNVISQAQFELVPNQKEFFKFTKRLDGIVLTLHALQLTRALRSLLYLHQEDNSLIRSLENHAIWLAGKMTFSELVQIALIHQCHQETGLRQNTYKQLLQFICHRVSELSTAGDLVSLLYMTSPTVPDLQKAVEEKLLSLCSQMSAKDCYRAFYLMGRQKRRNQSVLQAVATQLNKHQLDLDLVHLSNLAFACANLNFYNDALFENMSHNASKFVVAVDGKNSGNAALVTLLTSLLQSFSAMRFRKLELLDQLAAYIIASGNEEDVVSLVQSCATLNYTPAAVQADVAKLALRLDHLQHSHPKVWLKFVWSLAVLNLVDDKLIASVLNKNFIAKLSGNNDDLVLEG